MPGASGSAWLLAGLAWAVATIGTGDVGGLAPAEFAAILLAFAAALLVAGWVFDRSRSGPSAMLGALFASALLAAGSWGAYANRASLLDVARQFGEEFGLAPPDAIVTEGGEVVVTRRRDGTFAVPARINEHPVRFLFDTGASSVVLSEETARTLGLAPQSLNFRVPVMTANGRGLAAAVTLDRMTVGSIRIGRVPALVVRAGLLDGNLLGQSFLERLSSYEVRGNRLVLRAGKS